MDSSTLRRKITTLLLGVSLLASAAGAADLWEPTYPQPLQLLARLASFLDSLWEKEGASLDPDARNKEGAGLDPWGLQKNGASLDPNGSCYAGECSSTPTQLPVAGTDITPPPPTVAGGF